MTSTFDPRHLADLFQRARTGDLQAGQTLLRVGGLVLKHHIRKQLAKLTRRFLDSDDLVSMSFRRLFHEADRGRVWENPAALCAFLVQLARFQTRSAKRQYGRPKYEAERLAESLETVGTEEPLADDAGPEDLVIAEKEWDDLLAHVSEMSRDILILRRADYSFRDIADNLDYNERTIRKHLQEIRSVYHALV